MKIRCKIISSGIVGVILTALVLVCVVTYQRNRLHNELVVELNKHARQECAAIAKAGYLMVRTQHESVQNKVKSDLNVARAILEQSGSVSFSEEEVSWEAINQYTKSLDAVTLPGMQVGNLPFGQNRDLSVTSPIVDTVQSLVGGTCTVFQRMNDTGDMLRVCTNVEKRDGTRAVGTYIPALNPDGTPNPVVSKVLQGETFYGRAYVVNAWYITAYEPIMDDQNRVAGVLYVGVKQENVNELRAGIMDVTVGKTGYVYVLGGSGKQQGQYVISKGGTRDGESIWNAKDAGGTLFIQEIVEKALVTEKGECDFQQYPWQNKNETTSRMKVAAVTYFEPWDWVIGVGAYEDDFQDAIVNVEASLKGLLTWTVVSAVVILLCSGAFSVFMSGNIVGRIGATSTVLKDLSQGEGDLTRRFELKGNPTHEDEMGRLERHFNAFADKIQKLIRKISENAETVNHASRQLTGISEQMKQGAEHTSGKTTTVAASSEEMSSNMNSVAAAMEQAATNMSIVSKSTEQMTASIGEIAHNTERASAVTGQAVTEAQGATRKINELGSAADEIGKVTETITEISDQTNLLALNATIEAARAGEAGKGFAVVANEIKDLANQTAEATGEIRSRIESIQDSTGQSVEEIEKITKVIGEVNDIVSTIASAVEQQSATTREIAGNVTQASEGIAGVNENVAQTSTVAGEIARDAADVNTASNEVVSGSGQVNASATELSQLSEQLRQLVGQFKV